MTFLFEKIAEEKIKDWIKNADLSKNEYFGKKVDNSDYFKAPPNMRICLHILKNSNVLPKECQLRKDITNMKNLLLEISDEREFFKKIKQFNSLVTEYNILTRSKGEEFYCRKLMKKIMGFSIDERKSSSNSKRVSQK